MRYVPFPESVLTYTDRGETVEYQDVRPSSQPLFHACPSSVLPPAIVYNPPSEPAWLGTLVHKLIAKVRLGEPLPENEAQVLEAGLVQSEDLEHEDTQVEFLLGRFAEAWGELVGDFPGPKQELRLSSPITSGTCDLFGRDQEVMSIGDWKTGSVYSNCKPQLMAYAYAAWVTYGMPNSGRISAHCIWLRMGRVDTWEFTADDMDDFEHRHFQQLEQVGKVFNPGTHCGFCPRQLECEGLREYERSAAKALIVAGVTNEVALSDTSVAELKSQRDAIKRAIDRYDSMLKARLMVKGRIECDAYAIELQQQNRASVHPIKAWPVLLDNLTEAELNDCMEISKTKAVNAVRAKAVRGKKKYAEQEFVDELEKADAINYHTVFQARKVAK